MKILYTHTEAEALMLPEVQKVIDLFKNLYEEYKTSCEKDYGYCDFYTKCARDFFHLHLSREIEDEKLPFKVSIFQGSYAVLVIHKKKKCVIKIGGITDESSDCEKIDPPKYAIQTCFVFIGSIGFPIRIQPFVDCRSHIRRKSYSKLFKIKHDKNLTWKESVELFGDDFYERNVGMYQGKPVVVDW